MSQVDKTALHNFVNGETVQDTMLDQNFEVIRISQNDTDQKATNALATMITKATADQTYTPIQGDHKGTWQGLSPATVVSQGVDGARLTALEQGVASSAQTSVSLVHGLQKVDVNTGGGQNIVPFNVLNIKGRTLVNMLGRIGNLESTSGWTLNGTTTVLDTTNKLYGSNGFKVTTTGSYPAFGTVFYPSLALFDKTKYHVVVLDVKNNDATSAQLLVEATGGNAVYGNLVTSTTGFNSSFARLQPSDITNATAIMLHCYVNGSSGKSAFFDGLRVYQITQTEYNALASMTPAQVADKYPYVDDLKSINNPFVNVYGQNLLPDFSQWTLDSHAVMTDPYKLTLNATAGGQYSDSPLISVIIGQPYALSAGAIATGSYVQVINMAKNAVISSISGSQTATFTPTESGVYLRIQNDNSGIFTFSQPMLNLGSTALPFVPKDDSPVYFQTALRSSMDQSIYDSLSYRDGQFWKTNRFAELILDGSLTWVFGGDLVGYKTVHLDNNAPIRDYNLFNAVKYDGKILTPTGTFTGGDQGYFEVATGLKNLYLSITDIDSGWGETYTPTAGEIQAYFNGWKMYDNITINDSSTYSSGTKAWAYKDASGGWAGGTTTLPTQPVPAGTWRSTPYKLVYQLANPTQEIVLVDGVFPVLNSGSNQVELGEAVVVREQVTPKDGGDGIVRINDNFNGGAVTKYRMQKWLKVYKNGFEDTGWSHWGTPGGSNGVDSAFKNISAGYDPKAVYTITYLAQPYQLSSSVQGLDGSYESNLRKDVDRNTQNLSDLSERVSAVELGKASKGLPPWIAPTLLNGWLNYGNGYNNAGYYKDDLGIVHLRGLIKSGTLAQIVFYLPVGYRPLTTNMIGSISSNGTNDIATRLEIRNDGSVYPMVGGSAFFSLDGITFRAEQ